MSGWSILVADAKPDTRFQLQVGLRDYNISWFDARNMPELSGVLENERIDLLVIDFLLPPADAYHALQEVRVKERSKNLPVLVIKEAGFSIQAVEQLSGVWILTRPIEKIKVRSILKEIAGDRITELVKTEEVRSENTGAGGAVRVTREKPIVLIADDEEPIRKLVRIMLGSGYEVIEAKDGMDLLEKAKEVSPDLIISDVVMPGLSGWKTIARLREEPRFAATPVLFNSGLVKDKELYETLRPKGPSVFLLKPFKKADLVSAINRLLGRT